MYYVYIIQDPSSGKYYTGYTNNLQKRLREHIKGKTKSLRNRGPFRLVYYESYPNRQQAYRREQQIKSYKSYKGGRAFKKLIGGVGGSPPLRPSD